jgi:hypothetical protein
MTGPTHKKFLKVLDASQPAVLRIAGELARRGNWVLIPPFDKHAKTREEALGFSDGGDLFVIDPPEQIDELERIRLEVKNHTERQGPYSSAETYPYRQFFVCSLSSWERAEAEGELPRRFFYLNHEWTHFATIEARNVDPSKTFELKADGEAVLEDQTVIWVPTAQVNFYRLKEDDNA